MTMNEQKINFSEGSMSFWIPAEKIDYKGNKSILLFSYRDNDGSFSVIKNKGNGIQVNYDYFDKGICCLEEDASILDNDDKHMVAVTWSLKSGKMKLYIDGEMKKEDDIEKL